MVCPLRWVISRPPGDYVTGRSGGDHRPGKTEIPGGILLTIIGISIVGLIFDLTSISPAFSPCLH